MARHIARWFGAGRVALVLATVCVALIGEVTSSPTNGLHDATQVRPGELIQSAIDKAKSGDRIVVQAGTYHEQLTITTDGIELVGRGAIIVPPTVPVDVSKQNTCFGLAGKGTIAGICITGSDIVLANFTQEHRKVISVGKPIKDVSVTGFDVRGFSGENIAIVGGQGARVSGNSVMNGTQYGILTVGSKKTRITNNKVFSNEFNFIGICMDDMADVRVRNNRISGYIIGLCVQTPRADVLDNDVTNTCFGAFVDPFLHGAKIRRNHINATNPFCGLETGGFNFGIAVGGAVDTVVRGNLVEGQTSFGKPGVFAAGIAVFNDTMTTPVAIASGNKITQNTLRHNDLDLGYASTDPSNVFKNNKCTTPPQLCS